MISVELPVKASSQLVILLDVWEILSSLRSISTFSFVKCSSFSIELYLFLTLKISCNYKYSLLEIETGLGILSTCILFKPYFALIFRCVSFISYVDGRTSGPLMSLFLRWISSPVLTLLSLCNLSMSRFIPLSPRNDR